MTETPNSSQTGPIILAMVRFDDETWYGCSDLWVKVKEDNRLPPLKYERHVVLDIGYD